MKRRLVLALLASCLAGPVAAQDRSQRPDEVQVYLQQKQREFQDSDRAAAALGLGGSVTSLYNLLRDKGSFRSVPVRGNTAEEKDSVRDALVRTAAYYLASVGVTPDEVNRLQRAGLDPLASATGIISGRATLLDALTVTETAVLARVTGNSSAGSNALQRQVQFTPVRPLKGNAPTAPFNLAATLPQPPAGAAVGETYLLFLSETQARFNQSAGRRNAGFASTQQIPPLKLEGERLIPTIIGEPAMQSTTSELDSILGKYPSIFGSSGRGGTQ